MKYFKTSFQSGSFSKFPRFGFNLFANIYNAVDLPIPFVPTSPKTWPGLGVGSLCNLNVFYPYLWVTWFERSLGKLIILIAPNGQDFTHILHPIHKTSEIFAIADLLETWMQSLSYLLIGHFFLHSNWHFFGLHLSLLTMAILSLLSYIFFIYEGYYLFYYLFGMRRIFLLFNKFIFLILKFYQWYIFLFRWKNIIRNFGNILLYPAIISIYLFY